MADDDGMMQYFAKLGLDASEFLNGMQKSQAGVLSFYRDVTVSLNMTMMIFDRFLAYGQEFVNLSNQAAEYISTIDRLAVTTGMSTEELERWANVARYADSDITTLAASINKMQMNLSASGTAGDEVRQMLADMGVSWQNSDGSMRSSAELFPDIIQGLKGLESSSERVTVANAIFGKSYQSLAGYMDLSKQDMQTYFQTAKVLTEEQTESLREYEKAIKDLNASTGALANTAGSELAPSFSAWAGLLDGLGKNQGVLLFFGALNLALETVAEGFAILGGGAAATFALMDPTGEDFGNLDRYAAKLEQTTRDVAVMRDRFAHPEAYRVPEEVVQKRSRLTNPAPEDQTTTIHTSTEIVTKGIEGIRAGTISMQDLKWAVDQGNISWQEYNDIIAGLSAARIEDQKKAVEDLTAAQEKLNGINKDYAREMSILNPRDVSAARQLTIRHEWDVQDQEGVIGEAQARVDTTSAPIETLVNVNKAPLDALTSEYDGTEIGMTVTVDTATAEAQIQGLVTGIPGGYPNVLEFYRSGGVVSPDTAHEAPTAADIMPVASPLISESVAAGPDVATPDKFTLPEMALPVQKFGDVVVNIDGKALTKVPGVAAGKPERSLMQAGY